MKKFIIDLGVLLGNKEPIPLYYDNYRVIAQMREPESHQKYSEEVLAC